MKTAIDVSCDECASQPGEPCRRWIGWPYSWDVVDYFHSKRTYSAQFANEVEERLGESDGT